MNRAGRHSLPARQKELQGTDRKDREKEIVKFNLITIVPVPPAFLDTKAKKNFKNFCELLIEKKLLTNANIGHVTLMAQELSTYERANRELKKKDAYITSTPSGYKQPSPWVAIRNQAQKNFRDIAALFGLDPLSVQKIGPPAHREDDPFEKIQKKYKDLSNLKL